MAQFESADVLSAKRQREIEDIVNQIRDFGPDMIFIESTPKAQKYNDSLLHAFKAGKYNLRANETDQLGFRLARDLNLPQLVCVDYRDAAFPFDSLVKVSTAAGQADLLMFLKKTIDSIEASHTKQLKELSIKDMLLISNSRPVRDQSVGFYFDLLKAGEKENHVGSYLVSEWWRRNMVIYENILKRLTGNEKKILVIFGSAHTALLWEMMKYHKGLELVEVKDVLK